MLFILIFSVLLLFTFPDEINSQQRILEMPRDFLKPVSESIDHDPVVEAGLAWIVFSDRNNNRTSNSPGGTANFKEMKFMEAFYVVEEQGEFVRLVKDPNYRGLELSPDAEDYGWIHKSKLLLWSHCLVTERGKIANKAMVINTISQLEEYEAVRPDIVEFKDSLEQGGKTLDESKLFQFYFVLKKEEQKVLLAHQEIIIGQTREQRLQEVTGWAAKSRLIFWNHRVAVEPNWEPEAVRERRKRQRAMFLINEVAASKYKNGKKIREEEILWDNDSFDERPNGSWVRFPVLRFDRKDPDIFTAGVIGEINIGDNLTLGVDNREKYQIYTLGVSSMYVKGQDEPIFKYVLLLSRVEFYELVHQMRKLAYAKNRYNLFETWIQLIRSYVGDLSDEEIANVTIGEIDRMVFEIPMRGCEFFSRIRLEDILDPSRIPDVEILRYIESIIRSYEKLRRIFDMRSTDYPYAFRSNEQTYYWIDEDLLPCLNLDTSRPMQNTVTSGRKKSNIEEKQYSGLFSTVNKAVREKCHLTELWRNKISVDDDTVSVFIKFNNKTLRSFWNPEVAVQYIFDAALQHITDCIFENKDKQFGHIKKIMYHVNPRPHDIPSEISFELSLQDWQKYHDNKKDDWLESKAELYRNMKITADGKPFAFDANEAVQIE